MSCAKGFRKQRQEDGPSTQPSRDAQCRGQSFTTYYIQGGILTQRCSEAKLSKVRTPGRWSRSGRRRSSWEGVEGWVVGQRGRAWDQDELYLGCRTGGGVGEGRQTLEIREIVATTQAKHGRGVKGTGNWITFSMAPSNPWAGCFHLERERLQPCYSRKSVLRPEVWASPWALACWLSPTCCCC